MGNPPASTKANQAALSSLLANLVCSPEASPADVELTQARITSAVQAGQAATSIAASVLLHPQQLGSMTGTAVGGHANDRMFLSGLPATLAADGGVPAWAHGMASPAVAPAMHTIDGLPAQLHAIDLIVQPTLVRAGDPEVLLSLDLHPLSSGRSFVIGAGSVWFAAGRLAPGASGGFAGLRITKGVLTADADLTFAGLQAVLPAGATATLVLDIEQPGAAQNPVLFPPTVTIVLAPGTMSLAAGGPAVAVAFGATVQLASTATAAGYDAVTRDLTMRLVHDAEVFAPAAPGSALAALQGTAALTGAVWAIPVAFNAPANLGKAAGAGAICLLLGPGIALQLVSPGLTAPLRKASVSVGADTLEFTGELAVPVSANLLLWDGRTAPASPARPSFIALSCKPGDHLLLRVAGGTDTVSILGACTTSIDRPVTSAGAAIRATFPSALLAVRHSAAGTTGYVLASQAGANDGKRVSLVLENALLIVGAAQSLIVTGPIEGGRIQSGALRLALPLFGVVATLPDPYAANDAGTGLVGDTARDVLTVATTWSAGDAVTLDVASSGAGSAAGRSFSSRQIARLLDVSTNADLFGVTLAAGGGARIDASVLRASGTSVALFTVPGISWEPVEFDDPTITIDPPPNDGERTAVTVASVRLVPVEPAPLLRTYVDAVNAGAEARMRFMLPFGLLAEAALPARAVPDLGASFELVTPVFPQGLAGGLQLAARPPNPGSATAGFPGSVATAGPGAEQVLGADVFSIFDGQFGATGRDKIVPVRRVDLSGYGNSMFSDWLATGTDAGTPAVAEARFDVIVGRTSYEVIQVVSVILPWSIRVVRTVTMARQVGGRILRSDTGWVALSDGNFDLPPGIVAHKGPVARVTNVHNIKDQGQDLVLVPAPPGLEFRPVTFDADVVINAGLGVSDGGVSTAAGTAVPSLGLDGFLQLRPIKQFVSSAQLADLMAGHVVGGALACTVDLGGPSTLGPLMRVTGIGVTIAGAPGATELVVALLGTPRLPATGSWSVARLNPGDPAPTPLDKAAAVPLIRSNGNPAWHLADPSDVNRLTAPQATQYGLLQATGTQRAFFGQPHVPQGTSQIGLGQPPHLADVASLLSATGIFPELAHALQFDQPPQVNAVGDVLTVQRRRFSLAGVPPRLLLDLTPVRVLLAYADIDGHPAFADVQIDPAGSPSWTIDIGTVSLILVLPPFGTEDDPLLRLTGSIHVDSLTAPTYKDLVVHFGGTMSLIQQVFSRLQELAKLLPGGSANLDVSFSDGRLTIRDSFTLPNLPLGMGTITDIGMDLGLTVSISPPAVDFQVGIATPEKPFHWVVFPLSGTGAVVVGSKDGRPTILIQGGLGVGVAIDVGIASGSASIVLALQVDNRVAPLELKVILTGTAAVDVLAGLASAALTLSAAMAIVPDKLPMPHEITLFAEVAVGIHLSLCWVASIDFDGPWHVQQTLTSPIS
jgi:hypothetical protein